MATSSTRFATALIVLAIVAAALICRADSQSGACGGAICPAVIYETSYSTCISEGSTQLTAYQNCCALHSCIPDASGCALHLNDGTTLNCSF